MPIRSRSYPRFRGCERTIPTARCEVTERFMRDGNDREGSRSCDGDSGVFLGRVAREQVTEPQTDGIRSSRPMRSEPWERQNAWTLRHLKLSFAQTLKLLAV